MLSLINPLWRYCNQVSRAMLLGYAFGSGSIGLRCDERMHTCNVSVVFKFWDHQAMLQETILTWESSKPWCPSECRVEDHNCSELFCPSKCVAKVVKRNQTHEINLNFSCLLIIIKKIPTVSSSPLNDPWILYDLCGLWTFEKGYKQYKERWKQHRTHISLLPVTVEFMT